MDSAVSALIGAGIGAGAGIASQFIAARLAGRRSKDDRERREARTRAGISAMLVRLHEVLELQAVHGAVWASEPIETAFSPILKAAGDTDLLQDLEPDQIRAVIALAATVETAMPSMRQAVERGEQRAAAASTGADKAEAYESIRRDLRGLFSSSRNRCREARVALGEKEPLRITYEPETL